MLCYMKSIKKGFGWVGGLVCWVVWYRGGVESVEGDTYVMERTGVSGMFGVFLYGCGAI